MPSAGEPGLYEIRVHGCVSGQQAVELREPIARLLCPDPWHDPPCEVPWGVSQRGDEEDRRDGTTVLVVGVYTSPRRVAELAERVRAVVPRGHSVVWDEGVAEDFEEVVEQYRIEWGGIGG